MAGVHALPGDPEIFSTDKVFSEKVKEIKFAIAIENPVYCRKYFPLFLPFGFLQQPTIKLYFYLSLTNFVTEV